MPVTRGHDSKGSFYRWGKLAKYYYTPRDKASREKAKRLANRQGRAVHISQWYQAKRKKAH